MTVLAKKIKEIFHDNWIVTIPIIYICYGVYLDAHNDSVVFNDLIFTHEWINRISIWILAAYLVVYMASKLTVSRGGIRLGHITKELREHYLSIKYLAGFVIIYLTLSPFFSIFGSFKISIAHFNYYAWDERFMALDRLIHFGHHPWQLLQPVLGLPSVTKFLDILYIAWFYLLVAVSFWMAFSRNRSLRRQYFTCYFLIWILLGTLLATVFSSVGPCYYDKVVAGDNPFSELFAYLHTVHYAHGRELTAIVNQDLLWQAYVTGQQLEIFGGISAMPSLHVAMAVLFCLVGWRTHRFLGMAFSVYAMFILLGSVMLGWHYAIDGYASAILTMSIWYGVGYLMRNAKELQVLVAGRVTGAGQLLLNSVRKH